MYLQLLERLFSAPVIGLEGALDALAFGARGCGRTLWLPNSSEQRPQV